MSGTYIYVHLAPTAFIVTETPTSVYDAISEVGGVAKFLGVLLLPFGFINFYCYYKKMENRYKPKKQKKKKKQSALQKLKSRFVSKRKRESEDNQDQDQDKDDGEQEDKNDYSLLKKS